MYFSPVIHEVIKPCTLSKQSNRDDSKQEFIDDYGRQYTYSNVRERREVEIVTMKWI
jgi:hypothetical protein